MTITLETLKNLFSKNNVWEIDFRDVSIETKANLYAIKKWSIIALSIFTAILGILVCTHFVEKKSLEKALEELQNFVSKNETKNIRLLSLNKSFHEERNEIATWVNLFKDEFEIQAFLQDLLQQKAEKIKFDNILIQKEKKDAKEGKLRLTVKLNGCVKKDIDLVESLKNDILKCPSLSKIAKCKSFFQLDHNDNKFQEDEIKFQLTIQSNE